jgi:hypothetical protein
MNTATATAEPKRFPRHTPKPTREQFAAYQAMYDHFNRKLFAGSLPPVILNFSRKARSLGFFAAERWESGAQRTHEISINPAHLKARPAIETASTLVHEMVHLWQQEQGSPSRTGYHNHEWAAKMEAVGLMPSSTGEPGGRKVGQHMTHYIVEGGSFQRAFAEMPAEHLLPWMGVPEPERDGGGAVKRNKSKYTCPKCLANVWGKPDMVVICGPCDEVFALAVGGEG